MPRAAKPEDLLADLLPTHSGPLTSDDVDKWYAQVIARALKVQDWYFQKKKSKSRWGFALRFTSVGTLALAGIFPVISQMSTFPPGFAAIVIAIATACVLLDKLGGFTSGWIR